MRSTMLTAVRMCRKRKAKKIVVEVPVSGKNAIKIVEKEVNKIIVLEKSEFFMAVANS